MNHRAQRPRSVLTIAGSDSGGGAGIQADLKTFAAFGLHGLSAITAVTAQNTRRVVSVHCLPAREVVQQIETVFDDFDVAAVKIGMLGSRANVAAVAAALRRVRARNIVLDPVLVATSGRPLLPSSAVAALRARLVPLATVLTPNLPEAAALLGHAVGGPAATRELLALGACSVLLKGGHARGALVRDVLVDAHGTREFRHRRLPFPAHGTGCVLAAAIAAGLALGRAPRAAVAGAEAYLQRVLRASYRPGDGAIRCLPAVPVRVSSRAKG
jgi:hydroxymethylpyrimidine/phosphomethylpyrimidine kinase